MERIRFDNFMVHFNTEEITICFNVFPVLDWTSRDNSGMAYIVKGTGCEHLDAFDEEKARKLFEGSFCWRGMWEGRLYFTQDEYWGEDLEEMADLYENKIVPWCKDFIKKREPHGYYDD